MSDLTPAQVFQGLLALVLLFGTVVLPLAGIISRDVPTEDLKRDVREGL